MIQDIHDRLFLQSMSMIYCMCLIRFFFIKLVYEQAIVNIILDASKLTQLRHSLLDVSILKLLYQRKEPIVDQLEEETTQDQYHLADNNALSMEFFYYWSPNGLF